MRYAAVLCVWALGGCQSTGFSIDSEPVVSASNELNQLGKQELASGNFGLAERHFRKAVEANGDDSASWIGLAAAYDNLGRFELADRAYEQAIALEGETLPILNNRGYSYYLRGDRTRALATFRRAQALFPGSPFVLNNISLARTGERPNRTAVP
jgi:Flp pilus assembly protein TadD